MNILRMPAVKSKTGLAKTTIYRKVRSGEFPKPIKLSERASGWDESLIDAWLQSRIAA